MSKEDFCNKCNGEGEVHEWLGARVVTKECDRCNGVGLIERETLKKVQKKKPIEKD